MTEEENEDLETDTANGKPFYRSNDKTKQENEDLETDSATGKPFYKSNDKTKQGYQENSASKIETLDRIVRCIILGETLGNFSEAARVYGYSNKSIEIYRSRIRHDKNTKLAQHYALVKSSSQSYSKTVRNVINQSLLELLQRMKNLDSDSRSYMAIANSLKLLADLELQGHHLDATEKRNNVKVDALTAIAEAKQSIANESIQEPFREKSFKELFGDDEEEEEIEEAEDDSDEESSEA